MAKLKMHLVLADWLAPGQAAVACSHASLGTYLEFKESPLMTEWLSNSFVKIIHMVPPDSELFTLCRMFGPCKVFTESSLGNKEVCIGFDILPMAYDFKFKAIPLYKGK